MNHSESQLKDCIAEAIRQIEKFVLATTGRTPSQEEIAAALRRYFVLNEIKEHICMARENPDL